MGAEKVVISVFVAGDIAPFTATNAGKDKVTKAAIVGLKFPPTYFKADSVKVVKAAAVIVKSLEN